MSNELHIIIDKYKAKWSEIKKKYPQASGSVNFAFKGEFVPIGASLSEIVKKNPYVFLDGSEKTRAVSAVKTQKDISDLEVRKILANAPLNPECRLEIIWNDLDYDLIWQLQKDPLIDQNLTPQTKASIRIVLGTIG